MLQPENIQSAHEYIHWCADMANEQNVGVPWIMCQQDNDVPPNVVSKRFNSIAIQNILYLSLLLHWLVE